MKTHYKKLINAAAFLLLFLIYGELDFRLLSHENQLEYDADADLYSRIRPNQTGFVWMANMTRKSPVMSINRLGLRGPEVQLDAAERMRILATGSSYALGSGVLDHETWTAQLQERLQRRGWPVDVLNAASSGWGPYQHAVFVEKHAAQFRPCALLILVSERDKIVLPKSAEESAAFLEEAQQRKKFLAFSPFAAFCLRRLDFFYQHHKPNKPQTGLFSRLRPEQRLSRLLETHGPYWERIRAYAQAHKLPVVFFVLNADESLVGAGLAKHLRTLEASATEIKVVALTSSDVPEIAEHEATAYVQKYLSIPDDGHPNAEYHRLMAMKLERVFSALLPPMVNSSKQASAQ
jgi:hypothetical protein